MACAAPLCQKKCEQDEKMGREKRERKRETEQHRDRDRETERQRDRETERLRQTQTETESLARCLFAVLRRCACCSGQVLIREFLDLLARARRLLHRGRGACGVLVRAHRRVP